MNRLGCYECRKKIGLVQWILYNMCEDCIERKARLLNPKKEIREIKEYNIYFDQTNQCRYEIRATTEEKAIEKAKKEWRGDWIYPIITVE